MQFFLQHTQARVFFAERRRGCKDRILELQ